MSKQQLAICYVNKPNPIESDYQFLLDRALTASEIYGNLLKDYPDILDVSQVSNILGVSSKTVYRLLNKGILSSLKVGRAFKVPKLYVLQYIKVLSKN